MSTPWTPDPSGAVLGRRGSLFPDLEPFAYLAHAGISPPSTEVRRAVEAVLASYARRGIDAVGDWMPQRARLRERLARLLGVRPEDVAFVANTTTSVIATAQSIPWRRGDRILCFRGEFPTNVTPWQQAAALYGLDVRFLDAEALATDEGLAAVDRVLAEGVRLVAVSAVQFQTGLRMPLEGLVDRAHAAGAEVFVDAIQALGAVPLDAGRLGVDYLGCGSHKFLMGLEGVGFLYVRPDRQEAFVPRLAGWLSHEEPVAFLFEPGRLRYDRPLRPAPGVLEAGAPNVVGLAALEASIALIERLGVEAIHGHIQRYLDALEPPLVGLGFRSRRRADPSRRGATLSLEPPEGLAARDLRAALARRRVTVSIPEGLLRFAPQWPNSLDEVPRVVEAVEEARAEARGARR
ncbi:MAG: aminotransferase class V-fold PLP-dependent enzyme [Sandaracinaceae bacterium]